MPTKGRGWHGDSEGHARAGRKGGEARARKIEERKNPENREVRESEM